MRNQMNAQVIKCLKIGNTKNSLLSLGCGVEGTMRDTFEFSGKRWQ